MSESEIKFEKAEKVRQESQKEEALKDVKQVGYVKYKESTVSKFMGFLREKAQQLPSKMERRNLTEVKRRVKQKRRKQKVKYVYVKRREKRAFPSSPFSVDNKDMRRKLGFDW